MEELRLALVGGLSFTAGLFLGTYLLHKPLDLPLRQLVDLVREIKTEYHLTFQTRLQAIRQQRRKLNRISEEYEDFVYEMMDASNLEISRAQDAVLRRHSLPRSEFERRISLYNNEPLLASVLGGFSKISASSEPLGQISLVDLKRVLEKYYSLVKSPTSAEAAYLSLTVYADDVYEEFGYEIEEIELAALKQRDQLPELYQRIQEANQGFTEAF
jgi:hypothetical protein